MSHHICPQAQSDVPSFELLPPSTRLKKVALWLRFHAQTGLPLLDEHLANARSVLTDTFLRDALLYECIYNPYLVDTFEHIAQTSPAEDRTYFDALSFVAQSLAGKDNEQVHLLGDRLAKESINDAALKALFQLARQFSTQRFRDLYITSSHAIVGELSLLDQIWKENAHDMHIAEPWDPTFEFRVRSEREPQ